MTEFLWLGGGVLLAEIADWLLRLWRQNEDRQRRQGAEQVLKARGLTPQLYLASVGEEDPELRSALNVFASNRYIITNTKGEVVGKLCPKAWKRPYLRLVVSST
ncbi:hypothetical protein LMG667_17455 [Xanthomonas euvesicatoria]|uniref:hypothetical protein n=1 Tax=Xanthomonas euvesicatoria TaxID=456327 RepID=UPI00080DC57D|nr:hypothetical protein [Xanthomonas euvesicatoria]OCG83447.1 hypothetical protein LMG667_17455 [Xanthomonas euvesicatoria]